MTGRLDVWHLDVFARAPGGGNPCPIVLDAGSLSTCQMQAVAAHYGQETGFAGTAPDGAVRLRFFVPRHEMSMCVHATVAAVTVLAAAERIAGGSLTVRTGSGECAVSYTDARPPVVTVEQQPPHLRDPLDFPADRLARAAGVDADALDRTRPVQAVSVSRPKLIVPLRSAAAVHAATPDLPALWAVCREADATGAYLFGPHPDRRANHVAARQFPVDAGYPEDPATGVAAAALAAYLARLAAPQRAGWYPVDVDQGDAMGRPSSLRASAFADATGVHRSIVSGSATLRDRTRLDLAEFSGTRRAR